MYDKGRTYYWKHILFPVIRYVKVHGGGWYLKDDARRTMTLYGSSGDYGDPRLSFLNRIPRELEGYTFIFSPGWNLPGNVLDLSGVEWF